MNLKNMPPKTASQSYGKIPPFTRDFLFFSQKSVARIMLLSLLIPVLFPIGASVGFETEYTYANEDVNFILDGKPNSETSIQLSSPKTSFVIQLETESLIEDESLIGFTLKDGSGTKKSLGLEVEGGEAIVGKYYTHPTYFPGIDTLTIQCTGCEKLISPKFTLRALDPSSYEEKMTFKTENFTNQYKTDAAPSGLAVVPRGKWGADETLRYKTHPTWVKIFEQNEKIKPSEASLKAAAKNEQIEAHLRKEYPQDFVTNEVIRSHNGNDLVWPIEKSKYVKKIVLHHTGEGNSKNLSDEEIMRSIYYYHTIVRGWGDVGYQYIIGQQGTIYEGRAGGDYTVGAHASWNNRSSVGVSVMGNFENQDVTKEQQAAIVSTVTFLAQKYGIDVGKKTMGHKACKIGEECATRSSEILSLMGHRDVGYTSCPGVNLYSLLIKEYQVEIAAQTTGFTFKANKVSKPRTVNPRATTINTTRTPNVSTNPIERLSGKLGPSLRVKLSFPETLTSIELESIGKTQTFQSNATKKQILSPKVSAKIKNGQIEYEINGKKYLAKRISLSSDVIRISNWNRFPAWDTSGVYNDNEFRGKIEIGIENGKLLVINELPLEAYLRGLAEFSNGENQAKAETILIAARSYAYFYSKKENRKFPGKSYDASDDPDVFQKYLGYGYEKRSPTTIGFVKNTTGKIITYKNKPIKPWYFTQSSGQTLSAKQYCENRKTRGEIASTATCEDIPYLQSKIDIGSSGLVQKGHGVGISGAGASYLAQEKKMTNEQIIEYFLTGTKVKKIY